MDLSVYIHIPYCLQRCRYCDFTTFEWKEILPPEEYIQLVTAEIYNRSSYFSGATIKTLYFGGGTPSLISARLIVTLVEALANAGLLFAKDLEATIEINPATIDQKKLEIYLQAGINRFSVGAQTFNDRLLQLCGRRHSAQDTETTLKLLAQYDLNYSFDLLFALPSQTLSELKLDLERVTDFAPPHLSAYCLTVPEGHPMSTGRPPENEQIQMFELIETSLSSAGLQKYEISNFAQPGFESRHNCSYWSDQSFWGLGLSAHSYLTQPQFGVRFWNPKSIKEYKAQVHTKANSSTQAPYLQLPPSQFECLNEHEALTDFHHMFLRTRQGLSMDALQKRFQQTWPLAVTRLNTLCDDGLLTKTSSGWRLSPQGELVSNLIFERLTWSNSELLPS